MSKIEIKKENGKIVFELDDELNEFNYDGLEKIIEFTLSSDDEIEINCESIDLDEYKLLLEHIIEEARQDDFKKAVENAKNNKSKLQDLENLNADLL